MARDGSEDAKVNAAGALVGLALNDDNCRAIAAAGGIPVLVSMARDGREDAKLYAVWALGNLAMDDEDNRSGAITAAGGIPVREWTCSRTGVASEHCSRVGQRPWCMPHVVIIWVYPCTRCLFAKKRRKKKRKTYVTFATRPQGAGWNKNLFPLPRMRGDWLRKAK